MREIKATDYGDKHFLFRFSFDFLTVVIQFSLRVHNY